MRLRGAAKARLTLRFLRPGVYFQGNTIIERNLIMPIINPNMLRNIPLFKLLDENEIELLAQELDQKHFWAGQMIFTEGDPGGTMFIVYSGRVELFTTDQAGERVLLSYVNAGELFGEFSLLDDEPRSASAKAVEDTLLFIVDRNDLETLFLAHQHAIFDILTMLSRRIRDTDKLVRERVVARNVNQEIAKPATFGQRLSDFLTMLAGDIRFVYFSAAWFVIWIVVNTSLIPNLKPFDPFPFGLLTMVVSLEAIFLSLFVLISQNRQTEREKVRNDIEYEVNIKAEIEIRDLHNKVDQLQQIMLGHLQKVDTHIDRLDTQTNETRSAKNDE
jgi:CRP/FNR family transcriptional regulator, cyclic AMP receptor protein